MSLEVDSSYRFWIDGLSGTADANATTNFDYQFASKLIIFGFGMIQNGGHFGDYIKIQLIDKDNVLGYGANFIVATPVNKAYLDPSTTLLRFISDYGKTVPSGLYLRLAYTNTAEEDTVQVALNLHFVIPV